MPRLRTVSPRDPGWSRRRAGRGFVYLDERGGRLAGAAVERIVALAIPPAWSGVWICRLENGHLQAVGTDEAERRQYLYHPYWRVLRDRLKFDRVREAAAELPRVRRRVGVALASGEPTREHALAIAVRLLDQGYFRIGSDVYADAHGSFGLTTLRRDHVRRTPAGLRFCFTGKSGVEHEVLIQDEEVAAALEPLRRRRGGDPRLLAWKDGRRWRPVTDEPGGTATSRKRAVRRAVVEVASYLGNTPTVARNSYIDPRVIDLYESGTVVQLPQRRFRSPARRQEAAERAVLELLS